MNDVKDAVNQAVNVCIRECVLTEFLEKQNELGYH